MCISVARVTTGLRNSCLRDTALYEADFQSLRLRSRYRLVKYFAKLIRYGGQHKTPSLAIGTTIVVLRKKIHLAMLKGRNGCIMK
ncbi:hypothetical protein TNCV_171451 [Trichonephila clavipes]|nr:hypothetical protein TNCV_171451 [Trichonephila clavipes]